MGFLSKKLGSVGNKAPANPTLKNVSAKGIAGKSGTSGMGAGEAQKSLNLKGFSKGGKVQP